MNVGEIESVTAKLSMEVDYSKFELSCAGGDETQQYLMAGSPKTSSLSLGILASSTHSRVRARVAENPNCSVFTLRKLCQDSDPEVRECLAWNKNLNTEIVERLINDQSPDVRYSLAENPQLEIKYLEILANDENAYVASRAAKTLKMSQGLNKRKENIEEFRWLA
jgi:hypothetical protein